MMNDRVFISAGRSPSVVRPAGTFGRSEHAHTCTHLRHCVRGLPGSAQRVCIIYLFQIFVSNKIHTCTLTSFLNIGDPGRSTEETPDYTSSLFI